MSKKIPKEEIQKESRKIHTPTSIEAKAFGLLEAEKDGARKSVRNSNPFVVLKYYANDWECFSDWTQEELKQFSNFVETFGKNTWDGVYRTSGKGANKTGVAYTPYSINDMKSGKTHLEKVGKLLSEDINFFELRVSQKIRVHGFQSQSAFFLVLLDREHRVFPE